MKMKHFWAILLTLSLLAANTAFALNDTELEEAARAYVPASFSLVSIEKDRNTYELTFRLDRETYEVETDAETGAVLKVEYENDGLRGSASVTVSDETVLASVEKLFPQSTIVFQTTELDDRLNEIRLFFYTDSLFGTMSLNAETGDALDYDVSIGVYPNAEQLTQEEAQAQLLTLKPGAVVIKIELDKDESRVFWEGKATLDGKRYEFALDALTGELTEWERD